MHSRLLALYPLISDQVDKDELDVILRELENALPYDGAVVEFGCYAGTTSLFIRRVLDAQKDEREFHVYDSFAGLPEKLLQDLSPAGEQFKTGELAVTTRQFTMNFKKADLQPPRIHKGWFAELSAEDIPDSIAFAFLDGDYYESIMTPLGLIEKRLAPKAIVVVDDYANEALPGAQKAVDEWLQRHPERKLRVEKSLAIIN